MHYELKIVNVMGRLLFMIFVAVVAILVVMVINSYITNRRNNKMSASEKRKNFDKDIEAVAKEIKKRQTV